MNTVDLDKVLDNAVAGLVGDPELRLDVRRELLAHVEDAKAALPDQSESERLAGALKALGPATDMAGALVESNRRRMQFRGWVRGLLTWAAAPAAVAVAVGIGMELLLRAGLIADVYRGNSSGIMHSALVGGAEGRGRLFRDLSDEEIFLMVGDTTRDDRAARQKAIWERYPGEVMYFGNYVSELLAAASPGEDAESEGDLEAVLQEGMRLEPDNARYPYQLAGLRLAQAVEKQFIETEGRPLLAVEIKNPAAVDEAIQLLRQAFACPRYQRHTREVVTERLALLQEPGSLMEKISQFAFLHNVLLPDNSTLLEVARIAPRLADVLGDAGRAEDAAVLLRVWDHLPDVFRKDAFTLVDTLVVGAMIHMGQETVAPTWQALGRTDEAERVRRLAEQRGEPIQEFRQRTRDRDPLDDQVLKERASLLTGSLIPRLGESIDPASLTAGRRLDFVLVEQMWSLATIWVMTALMWGTLIIWVRWRKAAGAASAPFLLVPTARQAAVLFLAGVLAPIAAYALLSRLPVVGAREFSLPFLRYRFAAEFVLLALSVAGLSGWLAARFVRDRCAALAIGLPPRGGRAAAVFGGLVALGWVLCWATGRWAVESPMEWMALVVAGMAALLAAGLVLRVMWRSLRAPSAWGLYWGTWGRTLTSVYAVAVVLLALATQPGLRRLERTWVRSDKIMSLDKTGGFTRLESRMTQRILNELDEVWDKPAAE